MGDLRFERPLGHVKDAPDPGAAIRALSDVDVIAALAAASRDQEPYLANILATEALNRVRRTRAISDHLGEGVFAVDARSRITFLNAAAETALGWTDNALVGQPATRILPDDEHIRAVLREGGTKRCNLAYLLSKGGQTVPASLTISEIREQGATDAGEDIEGAIIIFQDISARLVTERRVAARDNRLVRQTVALTRLTREHEHTFAEAMDTISTTLAKTLGAARVGVWTYDSESNELRREHAFGADARNADAGPDVLRGDDVAPFFDSLQRSGLVAATDAAEDPRTAELCRAYLAQHNVFAVLAAAITVGGEWRGAVTAEHIDECRLWHEDEQQFVISVASVVATRMEARERLRVQRDLEAHALFQSALLEAADRAGTGVVVYTRAGGTPMLHLANESIQQILGVGEDVLRMRGWESFLAPEEAERLTKWGEQAKQGVPFPHSFATAIIRPDGTHFPIQVGLGEVMVEGHPASVAAVRGLEPADTTGVARE